MTQTTDERRAERERLRERALTADDPSVRREAIRQLAALERDRNRETYDRLEHE